MAAWMFFLRTPKGRRKAGQRFFSRPKYKVSGAAAQTLKCKYRLNAAVYDRFPLLGYGVVDAVNERIALLQQNDVDLRTLLENGQSHGWDAWETLYHEAISTLVAEGVLEPGDDLCPVAQGGVAVGQIDPN